MVSKRERDRHEISLGMGVVMPDNYKQISYTILNGIAPPKDRYTQRNPNYNPQPKYMYSIHHKLSHNYNLYTTIDKMQVGNFIEIRDRKVYDYVYTQANAYASKMRKRKDNPIPIYVRFQWSRAENIGRMWRIS